MQSFRYTLAFKRHIENKHKAALNPEDSDDDGHSDDNNSDPSDNTLDPPAQDDMDVHQNDAYTALSRDQITEFAACAIAKLKASSSVVQSTVDHVDQESSDLFSTVMLLQTKTEHVLDSKGVDRYDPDRQQLMETFTNFQNPFENPQTAYKQQKYFTESSYFIKPLEVPFAIAHYPRHNPSTSHVDQVARHLTFQYVPLKQLLKHVLESNGFMRALQENQPSTDGIMRDFHDGEFCQKHLFFSNSRNIAILLYVDACEIANPLCSMAGMHKIGVIYCYRNFVHHCKIVT